MSVTRYPVLCITTRSAPLNASVARARNARRKMCAAKYSDSIHLMTLKQHLTPRFVSETGATTNAAHAAPNRLAKPPDLVAFCSALFFFSRMRMAWSFFTSSTNRSRHAVTHRSASAIASTTAAAYCASPSIFCSSHVHPHCRMSYSKNRSSQGFSTHDIPACAQPSSASSVHHMLSTALCPSLGARSRSALGHASSIASAT